MKSINFILVITAFLLASSAGLSQSGKAKTKAVEKTDRLDNILKSANPALALSDAQKEQIIALELESKKELSTFRKNNPNEEEVKSKSKELKTATRSKINENVLTEDQAKAYKAYRKKRKAEKKK